MTDPMMHPRSLVEQTPDADILRSDARGWALLLPLCAVVRNESLIGVPFSERMQSGEGVVDQTPI